MHFEIFSMTSRRTTQKGITKRLIEEIKWNNKKHFTKTNNTEKGGIKNQRIDET